MNKRAQPTTVNLLDLKPSRNAGWETAEPGQVVVLMPKFTWGPFARWLMPRLKKPHVRVHLDEQGSFFWEQCDGNTSILQIAERMAQSFGSDVEPMLDSVGRFLYRLRREELIRV